MYSVNWTEWRMRHTRRLLAANVSLAVVLAASPAFAVEPKSTEDIPLVEDGDPQRDVVVVTGAQRAEQQQPTTAEIRTAEEIAETTSVTNAEDALRYLPNIVVRKRHIGDTLRADHHPHFRRRRQRAQPDLCRRRAHLGADRQQQRQWFAQSGAWFRRKRSARSTSTTARSRQPTPATRSAPSSRSTRGCRRNSKARSAAQGSAHKFEQYATDDTFNAWQASATVGNRFGPLSFWLSATHTDSSSHPLAYVTATQSATAALPADPVLTGAFADANRLGAPIVVLGAGGLEDQVQDNIKLKAAWDIDANTRLAYTVGRFANDTSSDVETYLRDAARRSGFCGRSVQHRRPALHDRAPARSRTTSTRPTKSSGTRRSR